MQSQTEIRALLDERGLRPRRHLGQHFLIDHNLLKRLVSAAAVAPGELVREVGERLQAVPGTKAYGAFTVLVQALAEVGYIAKLRPTCFWPLPNVDSAMFAIKPRPDRGGIANPEALSAFAVALFSKRRKQL